MAFYRSGAPREDAAERAIDLLEEGLCPPVAVLDAAAELGHADARVYALVYSEDFVRDRRVAVRRGGLRAAVRARATGRRGSRRAWRRRTTARWRRWRSECRRARRRRRSRNHRRGAAASPGEHVPVRALGGRVLPAVMRASFEADRRLPIRFVEPSVEGIRAETERLVRALGRTAGRGAFAPPARCRGGGGTGADRRLRGDVRLARSEGPGGPAVGSSRSGR